MLVQLKPQEESFFTIIYGKLRKLDALILCEGETEVKVIKTIIEKLGIKIPKTIGVTECSGINTVYNMTAIITLLLNLFRKVKALGILIDSEQMTVKERVESLINSIKAREFNIKDIKPICNQTYQTIVQKPNIRIVITVNGVHEYNFKTHKIEDHAVLLAQLENKINKNIIIKADEAKRIISKDEIIELIKTSSKENITKAYNHIICLVNTIAKT